MQLAARDKNVKDNPLRGAWIVEDRCKQIKQMLCHGKQLSSLMQ